MQLTDKGTLSINVTVTTSSATLAALIAAATAEIPSSAKRALCQPQGGSVWWRSDGGAVTAAAGNGAIEVEDKDIVTVVDELNTFRATTNTAMAVQFIS